MQCPFPAVVLGQDVNIFHPSLVSLYGCDRGWNQDWRCRYTEERGRGLNCKISSHTFICEGVVIDGGVFIGHGVMFDDRCRVPPMRTAVCNGGGLGCGMTGQAHGVDWINAAIRVLRLAKGTGRRGSS
jgi:hypothetical protein